MNALRTMTIIPQPDTNPAHGTLGKTGTLTGLTVKDVESVLGFASNAAHEESGYQKNEKVRHLWQFEVSGQLCQVWDYCGKQFSTYGPESVLRALFGGAYKPFDIGF